MGKNRPRSSVFRSRREGWAAFTRTLAVLALAIQCLVIQTHVDIAARDTAVQAAVTASHDGNAPVHRAKSDCIICQTAAAARTSLTTPSIGLPLLAQASVPLSLQTVAQRAPRIAAHAWRSRAPPSTI